MSAPETNPISLFRAKRLEDVQKLTSRIQDSPTLGSKTIKTRALVDVLPIYYVPETASKAARMTVFCYLVLTGKSSDTEIPNWQTFFLSFVCCIFPELVVTMRAEPNMQEYSFLPISDELIGMWQDQINRLFPADDDEAVVQDQVFLEGIPDFPDISDVPMTSSLVTSCTPETVPAYWALMLFYSCKTITADNRDYVASRRPKALMDRRGLHSFAAVFTGEHRFPVRNIPLIKTAFTRSTQPRIQIFLHHITLANSGNCPESLESITVTLELMRNMNMTYIRHIADLLDACPWIVQLDSIWNAFGEYKKMINHLNKIDPLTRDYYKIMYLDRANAVVRKKIEPLITCATLHAYQTKKSMKQYRINEDTMAVVAEFIKLAESYGYMMVAPDNQQKTEQMI